MSENTDNLVPVFFDDKQCMVPAGQNIVDAAADNGIEIPHYCYHPKLSVAGNCRMCLIELGMPGRDRATGEPMLNEDGSPKIMFMPKPAIACGTKAAPNMHIRTNSEMVKGCREGVMEFLLVNHPLDCPICDQAGECRLQEFATDYGRGYSRFIEEKNVKPKRTRLGPRVMLDDERCILCSRCIRFSKEIANDDVLGFIDRGSYSTLTCYPGKKLENNYSLNTVDICPVGALTSTDFRFKMRVWFLKETKSICTESSAGVNTEVGSREGKIYRITPRRNDAVNDTWMPDSGRERYKEVEADNRLTRYVINGSESTIDAAVKAAADIVTGGSVAFVGSGRASVEEQYLFRLLADAAPAAPRYVVAHTGENDGLLLTEDRTPNTRGALLTGFTDSLPAEKLDDLAAGIDAGEIDTVVTLREDLIEAGLTQAQLDKVTVVALDTHANATTEAARVVIPLLSVFEKSGSFVNCQFRLQRFQQAVPGPAGVVPDAMVIGQLVGAVRGEKPPATTVNKVWTLLSEDVAPFAGLSFAKIGDRGVLIDAGDLATLPFIETKILHYSPAETPALAGA